MPRVLEIAIQTAISRRGVSVIAMPGDIALRDAVEQGPRVHFPRTERPRCPSDDELSIAGRASQSIGKNHDPRRRRLRRSACRADRVAGKLQAPIVHAMRGKEFIEYDNPFDVGMTGLARIFVWLFRHDELRRLADDRHGFSLSQFLSQRRHDHPDRPSRRAARPPEQSSSSALIGDTKTTLRALLPKLEQNAYAAALEAVRRTLSKNAQRLGRTCNGRARQAARPSAIRRPRDRRTRRRRRGLSLVTWARRPSGPRAISQ